MKLKVTTRGNKKGRQPKNVTIVADKVNIVTKGNISRPIGYGGIGGVRGSNRQYQFSYDVNKPPPASVTSPGGTVEAPPEEPPESQNLIQNSLGRLGRLLGGYAFDYARQALFHRLLDANNTQDFNDLDDPNLVDTFAPVNAPRNVERGVGNDLDYAFGDVPGTVFGVNRGAQTIPTIAPNDQARITRSTQFPNYRPSGTQTVPTAMDNAASQAGFSSYQPSGTQTVPTAMDNAAVQAGGGTQDAAVQAGFMPTEAAQQTDTVEGVGLGTQTTQPVSAVQPRSSADVRTAMRSFGIGVRPDVGSQGTQTALEADMGRLFEEQQRLLNAAGVGAQELLAMNTRLGEMFQEAQSDYATVESINTNISAYVGTMLDVIIGDPRWRDIIPPDLSMDEQVRYMFGLVESRDPRFRNFVRNVGGFANRLNEISHAETQTDFVMPTSGTRSRNSRGTWQSGTQTIANPPSGLPKRKVGPTPTMFDERPRGKRVKTFAATGPPVRVRVKKPPPVKIRLRKQGPVQGPTMPKRIKNRPAAIRTKRLPKKRAERGSLPNKEDALYTNFTLSNQAQQI